MAIQGKGDKCWFESGEFYSWPNKVVEIRCKTLKYVAGAMFFPWIFLLIVKLITRWYSGSLACALATETWRRKERRDDAH